MTPSSPKSRRAQNAATIALDTPVAVVTGAGSGIGAATARALASVGAAIVAVGRRPAPLEATTRECEAMGTRAMALSTDVGDAAAVEQVIQSVVSCWGRIDILVNSAGVNIPERGLDVITPENWQHVMAVNVGGALAATKACLPVMRERGAGTIVNISSIAGLGANEFAGPAYSASKAALNSLTISTNLAERRHGIRACTVCSGEVDTPWLDSRPRVPTDEERRRMLHADDVAEIVRIVVTMPHRAAIEFVLVQPTVLAAHAAAAGAP